MDLNLFVYLLLPRLYNVFIIYIYRICHFIINRLQDILISLYYLGYPPYKQKVQLKKIIWRNTPDKWNLKFDTDFLSVHSEFCDPACILDEDVHLYNINDKIARFVRIPKHMDLYDSSKFPFVSWSMFDNATHVFEMPVQLAIETTKELKFHDIPIVLLSHTGRCGSTLLGNIFNETERVATLSIPEIFSQWTTMHRNGLSDDYLEPIIRCGMRYILRPTTWNIGKDICFIKPHSHHIGIFPLLQKMYPEIKILHLWRRGTNTVHSFERLGTVMWPPGFFRFTPLIRFLCYVRVDWACFEGSLNMDFYGYFLTILTAIWATKMKMYNTLRQVDPTIRATSYEDIVNHREKCIAAIFEYCGLDASLSHIGVKGLDYHSQEGKIKFHALHDQAKGHTPYEGHVKVIADQICDSLNVPRLNETTPLAGQLQFEE